MGIKELRKIIETMGIETSSVWAFNDKRKSFTRRLKLGVWRHLTPTELNLIKIFFKDAFEVSNYGHSVVVKIK